MKGKAKGKSVAGREFERRVARVWRQEVKRFKSRAGRGRRRSRSLLDDWDRLERTARSTRDPGPGPAEPAVHRMVIRLDQEGRVGVWVDGVRLRDLAVELWQRAEDRVDGSDDGLLVNVLEGIVRGVRGSRKPLVGPGPDPGSASLESRGKRRRRDEIRERRRRKIERRRASG